MSQRPESLGFKMSLPTLKSSAGHFRKPVRKSANSGLKVWVCGFANRFLTATICGFVAKKLKSTANQQHHWDRFCNFQKIRFYDPMYRQILVDLFLNHSTLLPNSSAVERLFPRGAAILRTK